jgi:hypothetical protein
MQVACFLPAIFRAESRRLWTAPAESRRLWTAPAESRRLWTAVSITAFPERAARDLDVASLLELSGSRKLRCSQQSKAWRLRSVTGLSGIADRSSHQRVAFRNDEAIRASESRRLWTAVSITAFPERAARDLDSPSLLELSGSRKLRSSQQSKAWRLRSVSGLSGIADRSSHQRVSFRNHRTIPPAESRRLWTAVSITAFLERAARDLDVASLLELSGSRKLRFSQQSKAWRLRSVSGLSGIADRSSRPRVFCGRRCRRAAHGPDYGPAGRTLCHCGPQRISSRR